MTVETASILGTAVEGRAQRGGDFRPLRAFRTRNWNGRWQSLTMAQDRLVVLPPIVLFKAGSGYWIVDGHNRVAVGLQQGQVAIDAVVTRLDWAAGPATDDDGRGSFAGMVAEGDILRAAGQGRLSPSAGAFWATRHSDGQ